MFKKISGFTLIELLVVIAIIGLLSTIAVAALGNARTKAQEAKVLGDLKQIRTAIEIMAIDTDEWPGHQIIGNICQTSIPGIPGCNPSNNELCADGCRHTLTDAPAGLTQNATSTPYSNWNGLYISQIPPDPWGHQYFLDTDYDILAGPGTDFKAVIGSYGPNGQGLNDYDSDDIIVILTYQ